MQLSQEQEAWTREKVLLEKALHLAQSQVARLKGEIRTDNLREITGPEADNALLKVRHSKCNAIQHVSKEFNTSQALTVLFLNTSLFLQRIYGKYLRSESFRKALIYQKKYLLLLLGGFQECEEATLSLLSRMSGRPSLSGMDSLSQRRRGLTRFRSAVRVSIALTR